MKFERPKKREDSRSFLSLLRSAESEEHIFAELYERYWSKVYHFAALYLRDEEEIKDAVQEIFLKLWDSQRFLKEFDNIENFLFIITRNHVGGGEYVTVQIAVPAQASATLPEEETEVVSDTVKTNVLEHVDVDKVEEARVEPVEEMPAQPALPKQSPVEETPKAAEKHPVGQVDKAKKVALRANLLRWATLTPDLGIEWRVNPSWGVLVNGSWTTWTWNGYDRRYALWEVMPEVRYYMGEKKAWYVGAMFKAGQFNYKLSDLGRQGDLLGGGITGGYQLRLTDALSMDFTLGLGYLHAACENYEVIDDVRVRSGNETKHWLGPINAGVTLVWKIF